MIPRIIHRVWIGPEEGRHERMDAEWWPSWAEHNPEWECITWRQEEVGALMSSTERDVYHRLDRPVQQADYIRVVILREFGGLYVDCDFQCLRPIAPLIDELESGALMFLVPHWRLPTNYVINAIGAAEVGHPAFIWLVEEMSRRLTNHWATQTRRPHIGQTTGPLIWASAQGKFSVPVAPPEACFPLADELNETRFNGSRLPVGVRWPESAYAVHHFTSDWDTGVKDRDDPADDPIERVPA